MSRIAEMATSAVTKREKVVKLLFGKLDDAFNFTLNEAVST